MEIIIGFVASQNDAKFGFFMHLLSNFFCSTWMGFFKFTHSMDLISNMLLSQNPQECDVHSEVEISVMALLENLTCMVYLNLEKTKCPRQTHG